MTARVRLLGVLLLAACGPDLPQPCVSAKDDEKLQCVAREARERKRPELCELIGPPVVRDSCHTQIAADANEPRLCAAVKNTARRNACLQGVAVREGGNVAACDEIKAELGRETCYLRALQHAAIPADVCAHMTLRKSSCFRKLAVEGDPALCDKVGPDATSLARRLCYRDAFTASRATPLDCSNLRDPLLLQECLRYRKPRACRDVSDPDFADECWYKHAWDTNASCERIQDPGLRRRCGIEIAQ